MGALRGVSGSLGSLSSWENIPAGDTGGSRKNDPSQWGETEARERGPPRVSIPGNRDIGKGMDPGEKMTIPECPLSVSLPLRNAGAELSVQAFPRGCPRL